jgi:small conductance mechanosensitive channel
LTDPVQTSVRKTGDRVISAVKKALDDAGIEIPFPQTILTMNDNKFKAEMVGKN